MIVLTPELVARSFLTAIGAGVVVDESQALDFNLARRTGVVINEVIGEVAVLAQAAAGAGQILQQLDLDPDNVIVDLPGDGVPELDVSRIFSQLVQYQFATAEINITTDRHKLSWRDFPMHQRPISITNLVHEVQGGWAARTDTYTCVLSIHYQVVELSLPELGMLNASRR